jgi:hypothetical protein
MTTLSLLLDNVGYAVEDFSIIPENHREFYAQKTVSSQCVCVCVCVCVCEFFRPFIDVACYSEQAL